MPTLADLARVSTTAANAELEALVARVRNAPQPDPIAEAVRDMVQAEAAYVEARARLYALCGQQVA